MPLHIPYLAIFFTKSVTIEIKKEKMESFKTIDNSKGV